MFGAAIDGLDDDEKSSIRNPDGTPDNPNVTVVNETGLYPLVRGARRVQRAWHRQHCEGDRWA